MRYYDETGAQVERINDLSWEILLPIVLKMSRHVDDRAVFGRLAGHPDAAILTADLNQLAADQEVRSLLRSWAAWSSQVALASSHFAESASSLLERIHAHRPAPDPD